MVFNELESSSKCLLKRGFGHCHHYASSFPTRYSIPRRKKLIFNGLVALASQNCCNDHNITITVDNPSTYENIGLELRLVPFKWLALMVSKLTGWKVKQSII